MRVVYLSLDNDKRVKIFSYTGEESKKPKYRFPKHIFTKSGLQISREYKKRDYIEPETLLFKSYKFKKLTLLKDIITLLDNKEITFYLLDKHLFKLFNYLKIGESFDGLKDKEFNSEELKVIREIQERFNTIKPFITAYKNVNEDLIVNYIIRTLSIDTDRLFNIKEYLDITLFKHPFVDGSYIVIDRDNFYRDNGYQLSVVKYNSSREIGRPKADVKESILYLKELPDYILTIVERMITLLGSEKRVFIIPIDKLHNRVILNNLLMSNIYLKEVVTETQYIIKDSGDEAICYTVFPPALSSVIKSNVKFYTNMQQSVDIYHYLYKDGKLDKSIPQSGHILRIKDNGINFNLLLGYDLPSRNVLNRISKQISSITLNYRKDNGIYRHTVSIELKSSDKGIFYSPFSSFTFNKTAI